MREFFRAAFDNLEYFSYNKTNESNVYTYLTLKILLYIINNKRITNRIANLYSKIIYKDLTDQLERDNPYELYEICADLGLDFIYTDDPEIYRILHFKGIRRELKTHFKIHFVDYLNLSSKLRDDHRKLVNNVLKDGYVYVEPEGLARLIQEQAREKLLSIHENINKEDLEILKKNLLSVQEFNELYEKILEEWELKKEDFEYSYEISFRKDRSVSKDFPPCVKEILQKAKEGSNLIHNERLFLVFFLLALDYPVENIVNLFSTLPDFDREKTEYQVNFAKEKEYSPHSCSKLKSLNLCKAKKYDDKLCLEGYHSKKYDEDKKIQHPLFYIQLKQYRSNKRKPKKKD
ncbi:MAG: DNA primase large subunit PriL [Promethearchaeota archaeon]|nr:MAG: DNA primase large subunit PriL [Candidatus Lokiarchaeota archaeon]